MPAVKEHRLAFHYVLLRVRSHQGAFAACCAVPLVRLVQIGVVRRAFPADGALPHRLRPGSVAGGQFPNGPGVGCGTTIGVPVRWPLGPGATPRETATVINATVTARARATTRATAAAIGAGTRLGSSPTGRVTGISVLVPEWASVVVCDMP
jgi:hypothetical protein